LQEKSVSSLLKNNGYVWWWWWWTYCAALFKGGSTNLTPFCSRGSTLAAWRSIAGVKYEKPLFHRGPHFAACAANRSSKPGSNMRRGAAEAVTATAPMAPWEREKARAFGMRVMFVIVARLEFVKKKSR